MLERSLETRLQKWLGKGKTIVLTGARQVGKTTILKKVFANAENGLRLNAD